MTAMQSHVQRAGALGRHRRVRRGAGHADTSVGGVVKRYYAGDIVTLWLGDALEVLRTLPDESANCCITSPPYVLRDYGTPGQYGLEATPAEYIERLRPVAAARAGRVPRRVHARR
jgi:hypothetical protein